LFLVKLFAVANSLLYVHTLLFLYFTSKIQHMPQQYCLALDLKNDAALIEAYKQYHQEIWPGIVQSIKDSGILTMQIYNAGNRLFMIIQASADFNFTKKAAADVANPLVQQWEQLMWQYQQALPFAAPGQKWVLMEKIFEV
jgi:L-rhamnose mutarotase